MKRSIIDYDADFFYRTIYRFQKSENDKLAKLENPDKSDIESLLKICSHCEIRNTVSEFHFCTATKENLFKAVEIFERYGLKQHVFLSEKENKNELICKLDKDNRKFIGAIHNKYMFYVRDFLYCCGYYTSARAR